tara:strand:+ start:6904 stop:7080 length:177 start_codon:yes stop_codon:yes gene_type:complete
MKKLYNKFLEKISKNKFRQWKLKQPLWLQLLIEIPIYILIFWILNLIFNPFGYKITPW